MSRPINEKSLNKIIKNMINVVENSKDEIFYISEEARKEYEHLLVELEETKEKVAKYIKEGDQLEQKVRYSRRRLSEVSRHFNKYSERDIREAYEQTHAMQMQLAVLQQKEKQLRKRRDELERRLITLDETIERASRLGSKIAVVLNYLYDDFKQVNDILTDAKEKQEFGLKIIEAQEDERKKISREIHDGPAQMLANILLHSELIERSYRKGSIDRALEEIKNIREMVRSSLYEVRRIIYDLRPMALDDLGLIPTLNKYIANLQAYHDDINIVFLPIGAKNKGEKRLYQNYEIALFRLIQEALQNAIRHAGAKVIKVKLEFIKNNINVVVIDDGKGFDPSTKKEGSFGLISMKERVEMLEGTFVINSKIGKGTSIHIKIPYRDKYGKNLSK